MDVGRKLGALALLLLQIGGAVVVTVDKSSRQLLVDGQRFFGRGVCYNPVPVGEAYGDWLGADETAQSIWTRDLDLMAAMNVNLVREYFVLYSGILVAVTVDYPEALAVVARYKSHPAILLWGFGNEKNFQASTAAARANHMAYVEEAANAIHQALRALELTQDSYLSKYFELEASYPNAMDVWCLNLYRGWLGGLLWRSNLPMLISEYGADAWDGYNQYGGQDAPTGRLFRLPRTDALVSLATELRDWRDVVAGGLASWELLQDKA
ncbi:hypothetical protein AK812_SmicGene34644 [Symbiodinium microadriaticum]|uniref:Beta-glucuronidase n=1 Tax=Symbiodinium microadriaticum TaxID=2951 RepID=A0A1Q9CNH7_SYMMI|nr:hypothetical protein AK812_SmicGene34644 [Symbiodinium microadriaticum]